MKDLKRFKHAPTGELICEECGKLCKNSTGLSMHIKCFHNMSYEQYFNKWIKTEKEGICDICENPTLFTKHRWYLKTCSKKCKNIAIKNKTRFNMDDPIKFKEIQKKTKLTNLSKYGVDNPAKSNEIKNQIKESFIKHYGVDNNMKSPEGIQAHQNAMFKKYGVKNAMQIPEVFDKMQKTSFSQKQYKDTKLYYQGSYELDFLDKYYIKFKDIQRGPTIKYNYDGKSKIYYPDFYMPSVNLIIEIKSSYLNKKDNLILKEKKKSCIENGYNFIIIIDKNYNEFIQTIQLIGSQQQISSCPYRRHQTHF